VLPVSVTVTAWPPEVSAPPARLPPAVKVLLAANVPGPSM